MLNKCKKQAIIEWFNCMSSNVPIEAIKELSSGDHFIKIIQSFDKSSCNNEFETVDQKYECIQKAIDDFFQTTSSVLVDFNQCMVGGEFELAKLAVLLLSALVQHYITNKCPLLQNFNELDLQVQEDIEHIISNVLVNNEQSEFNLANLASCLSQQTKYKNDKTSYTTTPVSSVRLKSLRPNTRNTRKASTSPIKGSSTSSPLKILLESPQLYNQFFTREKEREIRKLRRLLHIEENKCADLADVNRTLKNHLNDKVKEVSELKEKVSELRKLQDVVDECSLYKHSSDESKTALENLQQKVADYEVLKLSLTTVEVENKELRDQISNNEEKLNQCEMLKASNQTFQRDNELLKMQLMEEQNTKESLRLEIQTLQAALQTSEESNAVNQEKYEESLNELRRLQQSPEIHTPGESMEVVAEVKIEDLEITVAQQQATIQTLNGERDELTKENLKLKEENRKLKLNEKHMCGHVENMQAQVCKFTSDLKQSKDRESVLQKNLSDCQNKVRFYELDIERLASVKENLYSEINRLESDVTEREATICVLNERIKSASNEKHDFEMKLRDLYENVNDLIECIQGKEFEKQKLINLKGKTSGVVSCLITKMLNIGDEIRKYQFEICDMQRKVQDLTQQKKVQLVNIENLQSEQVSTLNKLNLEHSKLLELENRYQQCLLLKENIEKQLIEAQNEIAKKCEAISLIEREKESMSNLLQDKIKKNDLFEAKLQSLQKSCDEKMLEQDNVNKKLVLANNELNNKVSNLLCQKENVERSLEELKVKLTDQENIFSYKELQIDSLQKKIDALEKLISSLQRQEKQQAELLQTAKENSEILRQNITARDAEMDILQLRISELRQANESLRKENADYVIEANRRYDGLMKIESEKQLCEQRSRHIKTLQEDIAVQQAKLEEISCENTTLKEQIKSLTEENCILNASIQKREQEWQTQLNEAREGERNKKNLDEFETLKLQNCEYAAQIAELKKEKNDLQNLLQQFINENKDLKRSYEALTKGDNNELMEYEEHIETKSELTNDFNKRLSLLEEANSKLESELSFVKKENAELIKAKANADLQIHNFETLLAETDNKDVNIIDNDVQNSAKESSKGVNIEIKNAYLKQRVESLENENEILVEKIEDLERKLSAVLHQKALSEKEYFMCTEQKEEKIAKLESSLEEYSKKVHENCKLNSNDKCLQDKLIQVNISPNKATGKELSNISTSNEKVRELQKENKKLRLEKQKIMEKSIEEIQRINHVVDGYKNKQDALQKERDSICSKYASAKKIIDQLEKEKTEKDSLIKKLESKLKKKLDENNAQYEESLQKAKSNIHRLRTELEEERKASLVKQVPLEKKVQQLEKGLKERLKYIQSLEAQLSYASSQLRNLKQRSSKNSHLAASHSNPDMKTFFLNNDLNGHSSKHEMSSKVLQELPPVIFQRNTTKSIVETMHLSKPEESPHNESFKSYISGAFDKSILGTGSRFLSLDDEKEFLNHSSISDLYPSKALTNSTRRISELQRRNTLLRPHMRSCYPVETQMHPVSKFDDDALKAGYAVDDSICNKTPSGIRSRSSKQDTPPKRMRVNSSDSLVEITEKQGKKTSNHMVVKRTSTATSRNVKVPFCSPSPSSSRFSFKTPVSLKRLLIAHRRKVSSASKNKNDTPPKRFVRKPFKF